MVHSNGFFLGIMPVSAAWFFLGMVVFCVWGIYWMATSEKRDEAAKLRQIQRQELDRKVSLVRQVEETEFEAALAIRKLQAQQLVNSAGTGTVNSETNTHKALADLARAKHALNDAIQRREAAIQNGTAPAVSTRELEAERAAYRRIIESDHNR